MEIQSELIFVNDMVYLYPRNKSFVYQQLSLHTTHSDSRSDISAYVTSHVLYTTYKIIASIECATVLRANITRVTREYKAGESVPSYSRLAN